MWLASSVDKLASWLTSSKAGWYYLWTPTTPLPDIPGIEFVPMAWNGAHVPAIVQAAGQRGKLPLVLAFNEPDNEHQGGSGMTAQEAARFWPDLRNAAVRLGSPACAHDITRDNSWLDQFFKHVQHRPDFICVHRYLDARLSAQQAVENLKGHLTRVHEKYKLPLWVTEYNMTSWELMPGGGLTAVFPPTDVQAEFARASAEMMDGLPFVERYSWFSGTKYLPNVPSENTYVWESDGTVTAVGKKYFGI